MTGLTPHQRFSALLLYTKETPDTASHRKILNGAVTVVGPRAETTPPEFEMDGLYVQRSNGDFAAVDLSNHPKISKQISELSCQTIRLFNKNLTSVLTAHTNFNAQLQTLLKAVQETLQSMPTELLPLDQKRLELLTTVIEGLNAPPENAEEAENTRLEHTSFNKEELQITFGVKKSSFTGLPCRGFFSGRVSSLTKNV
jgi:hypothetical protein